MEIFTEEPVGGQEIQTTDSIGNYIADFYCPSEKLVVELDGQAHFTSSGQLRDEDRTRYLNSLGIRVVRFENVDVFKATETVLERIRFEFRINHP